jgi:hypothetical protein
MEQELERRVLNKIKTSDWLEEQTGEESSLNMKE